MKGFCKVAHFVFTILLGLCFNCRCVRADTVYLSTFNLNTVLEFDSAGNQSTFATTASGLSYHYGLAFDSNGNLYVGNPGSNTIEEFNSSGQGHVFASSGLSGPIGLAFDGSGSLYVANADNSTIEEFNSGGTGSVFATAASGVNNPAGLAFDASGNLYVANQGNYTVEEFGPGGTGSVFATTTSGISNPYGLAVYGGNLYVANHGDNTVEKFNASGIGSTFASFSTNGVGAYLVEPTGLAFDSSGNLYVATPADGGDILKIDPEGDMSVFASGFGAAQFLAIDVPEPSSFLLAALGVVSLAAFLKRHRR